MNQKVREEIDRINKERPGAGQILKTMIDKGLVKPAEIDKNTGRQRFHVSEEAKKKLAEVKEGLKKRGK